MENGEGLFHVTRQRSGYKIGWHRNFQTKPPPGRGAVTEFSSSSSRRLLAYIHNCRARYLFLGTLTVAGSYSRDGREFKKCLDRWLVWLMRRQRERAQEPGLSSVLWWLEFQQRGAPHAHLIYTESIPWRLAARAWAGFMEQPELEVSGTRFEAIREPAAMPSYVGKYASKWEQKEVPDDFKNVGRFWGIRGCRDTLTAGFAMRSGLSQQALAAKIRSILSKYSDLEKVKVVKWAHGGGVTVYPIKDSRGLERSGFIAEMEIALSQAVLRGEVVEYQEYIYMGDDQENSVQVPLCLL